MDTGEVIRPLLALDMYVVMGPRQVAGAPLAA